MDEKLDKLIEKLDAILDAINELNGEISLCKDAMESLTQAIEESE